MAPYSELAEEIECLVDDVLGARGGLVDLVDHDEHLLAQPERLLEHETRLRLRTLLSIHEQQHAVDHTEHALDLTLHMHAATPPTDAHVRGCTGTGRRLIGPRARGWVLGNEARARGARALLTSRWAVAVRCARRLTPKSA